MTAETTLAALASSGVVPVIRTRSASLASDTVAALRDAGFVVFELTLTIPDVHALLERLAAEPDLIVGAGTVPDVASARACIEAGARFIVSPFLEPDLPPACAEHGAACIVGALTPSEIRHAHRAGADAVKVFPADAVGGPAYLRAVRAVMPHIPLVPTGGVTLSTLETYLAAGAAFVGVGGDLAPPDRPPDPERARRFLRAARAFRDATGAPATSSGAP